MFYLVVVQTIHHPFERDRPFHLFLAFFSCRLQRCMDQQLPCSIEPYTTAIPCERSSSSLFPKNIMPLKIEYLSRIMQQKILMKQILKFDRLYQNY